MEGKINLINNNISFESKIKPVKKTEDSSKKVVDKFISANKKVYENQNNGILPKKILWSSTAAFMSSVNLLGYGIFCMSKKIPKDKFLKGLPLALLASAAITGGLQHIFLLNAQKKWKDACDNFNNINKDKATGSILNSSPVSLANTIAQYDFASGIISLNPDMVYDPIQRRKLPKVIKHELVHAKQAEMIARSKDGIKKLNYATFVVIANKIKNKKIAKYAYDCMYKELQEDKDGKYNDTEFYLGSVKVNFKNYCRAVHDFLEGRDINADNVPVVIDENHYKEVVEKNGALSPEDTIKAEKYYEAWKNYKPIKLFDIFNPWSSYYQNIIEKEAYKENPTIFSRLANK